jgi:hypothetical protein
MNRKEKVKISKILFEDYPSVSVSYGKGVCVNLDNLQQQENGFMEFLKILHLVRQCMFLKNSIRPMIKYDDHINEIYLQFLFI